MNGFTSATTNKKFTEAFSKGVMGKEETVMLNIKGKTGVRLKEMILGEGQDEVLFDSRTIFRVKSVSLNGKTPRITPEEILPEKQMGIEVSQITEMGLNCKPPSPGRGLR